MHNKIFLIPLNSFSYAIDKNNKTLFFSEIILWIKLRFAVDMQENEYDQQRMTDWSKRVMWCVVRYICMSDAGYNPEKMSHDNKLVFLKGKAWKEVLYCSIIDYFALYPIPLNPNEHVKKSMSKTTGRDPTLLVNNLTINRNPGKDTVHWSGCYKRVWSHSCWNSEEMF